MHFCSKCGNMYYIRLKNKESNSLVYYCRKCGHEDTSISQDNVIVSKTNVKKKQQKYHHMVNQYTKLDPTLPRMKTIHCPNESCPCNLDESIEKDIIYIRYDNENMKYIYLCSHCDKVWNTEDN